MSATAHAKSDFVAAEEIKGILHGRDRVEQERILRWVSESLSLAAPSSSVLPAPPAGSAALGALAPASDGVARDIKTFVQQKQPKSDNQLVTVIAYFYRFVAPEKDRQETLTTAALQTAARQGRGFPFKTPSVTLNNAVQQGYLDRAERGSYRINAVGENLVAMTLPGTGSSAAGAGSSKTRSKRKKKKKA